MDPVSSEVTALLDRWSNGDRQALDELVPLVFAEVREPARQYLARVPPGHTLQPAALAHEVYLQLERRRTVRGLTSYLCRGRPEDRPPEVRRGGRRSESRRWDTAVVDLGRIPGQVLYWGRSQDGEPVMSQPALRTEAIASVVHNLEQEVRRLRGMLNEAVEPSAATPAQEHPYVEKIPTVLSGEPVIKGSRTSVRSIVEYWKFGAAPETIAEKLPHLRLAQIFDALSYYDDHREEIEQYIARNRVPVDD